MTTGPDDAGPENAGHDVPLRWARFRTLATDPDPLLNQVLADGGAWLDDPDRYLARHELRWTHRGRRHVLLVSTVWVPGSAHPDDTGYWELYTWGPDRDPGTGQLNDNGALQRHKQRAAALRVHRAYCAYAAQVLAAQLRATVVAAAVPVPVLQHRRAA